jgi:hypothetical protein
MNLLRGDEEKQINLRYNRKNRGLAIRFGPIWMSLGKEICGVYICPLGREQILNGIPYLSRYETEVMRTVRLPSR